MGKTSTSKVEAPRPLTARAQPTLTRLLPDAEAEVSRLLAALHAARALAATTSPEPADVNQAAEALRTARRTCEAQLRDLQEALDTQLDALAEPFEPVRRDSSVVLRGARTSGGRALPSRGG